MATVVTRIPPFMRGSIAVNANRAIRRTRRVEKILGPARPLPTRTRFVLIPKDDFFFRMVAKKLAALVARILRRVSR